MARKIVAITGASAGIGAAAARIFAGDGAQVVLLARGSERIAALAGELGGTAIACDVCDYAALQAAFDQIRAEHGRLDVLINNAGVINPIAPLAEADPSDWARAIDINLKAVFYGMRLAIPMMRRQGGGTILTLSSGAAQNPYEGWSAYCAAKAGAAMLTRMVHLEEGAHGIRAIGLSPGTVRTAMQVAIKDSGINPVSQLDPAVHVPPEWPARALLWLAGPAGDDWLGQELRLRDEAIRRAIGLIA
jgi:NAD(P)-dependent dehydrogenase (short-subunit alcohol dehydrogenase family)